MFCWGRVLLSFQIFASPLSPNSLRFVWYRIGGIFLSHSPVSETRPPCTTLPHSFLLFLVFFRLLFKDFGLDFPRSIKGFLRPQSPDCHPPVGDGQPPRPRTPFLSTLCGRFEAVLLLSLLKPLYVLLRLDVPDCQFFVSYPPFFAEPDIGSVIVPQSRTVESPICLFL